MPAPRIFISYSHQDKGWLEKLKTHLKVLEKEGHLDLWDDDRIQHGQAWKGEILQAIDAASAAILLISADFLTSDFIRDEEVERFRTRSREDGFRVFPILIRDCAWQAVEWLGEMQMRPPGVKPLAGLSRARQDSVMAAIVREIQQIFQKARVGTATGTSALLALHQLPSPPADFTGREAELAELRRSVEQGGATISGLRGMGGVGKTTLALKLAEELKPSFPDAQIYLDLKGVDPEPLSPAQAMAHVIRSFHPDARLPERPEEMPGLFRSVLDGKKALLLMDNAANQKQVEPLIPPRGSVLLVTSRFHFTLPGLVVKDLDELSSEEARDLLLRIEPRIGESADEIARLCGGLPLALRLAGSALAERPDLSPAEYAKRLTDTPKRSQLAEASLTLSFELLSEDLRKRWRELGVFPGTFDAAAAAAVWAVEPEPAEEGLGALVKSSLVDGNDGRYRLHDLARAFAESRMTEAERTEARRRHAEHYAGILAAANRLYLEGGESVLKGLRLYDLEWGNIQAGQAWAAERAEEDEVAARLCSKYPGVAASCLDLRQPKRERIQWLERAVAVAHRLKDRAAEGRHLGSMGLAYASLGDARRAIELHEHCLQIAREIGDRRAEGNALNNLGLAYAALGDARRAIEFYEQKLPIVREIGDRRAEGNALGNMGLAYANLGDARRALEFYEHCLQIAREIGNRHGEGNALGNMGLAYANLGDERRAIELYEQRLQIAREIGDRRGEGAALGGLGQAYAALGDARRAIELYEQRLQIAREIGDRRGEGAALGSMGLAYAALGDARRAIELYEQRLQIAREIGDRRGEANALGSMGLSYVALGDARRAIELYEQWLQIAREIGDRVGEAKASWNLGLQYEAEGNLEGAVELMQVLVDHRREIGHQDAEKQAAAVEAIRARISEAQSRPFFMNSRVDG